MNAAIILDSMPRYRKCARWSARKFVRYFVWLWVTGCVAIVAMSSFRFDKRYLNLVAALTILPAMIGWFGVNGCVIIWHLLLVTVVALRDRDRPDIKGALLFAAFLALGIVFLYAAIGMVYVLFRQYVFTKS
jgi:heme A synthase